MPAGPRGDEGFGGHGRAPSWGCCLLGHLAAFPEGQRPRKVPGLCPNLLPPPAPGCVSRDELPGPLSPVLSPLLLSSCVCSQNSRCKVLGQKGLWLQIMRTGQLALPRHFPASCSEPPTEVGGHPPISQMDKWRLRGAPALRHRAGVCQPIPTTPWPPAVSSPASPSLQASRSGLAAPLPPSPTRDRGTTEASGETSGFEWALAPGIQTACPLLGGGLAPPGPLSALSVGRRHWFHHRRQALSERCCWSGAHQPPGGGKSRLSPGGTSGPKNWVSRVRVQDGAESWRQ